MRWPWTYFDASFFFLVILIGGLMFGFIAGMLLNPSLPRVEKFERVEILGHRFECREEKP